MKKRPCQDSRNAPERPRITARCLAWMLLVPALLGLGLGLERLTWLEVALRPPDYRVRPSGLTFKRYVNLGIWKADARTLVAAAQHLFLERTSQVPPSLPPA